MKNKVSALEQLRTQRAELDALCRKQENRLNNTVSYLGENWGSLLIKTVFSARAWSPSSGGGQDGESSSSVFSNITRIGGDILPMVWGFAQPYLISMATRKIKNFFTGKNKKKDKG